MNLKGLTFILTFILVSLFFTNFTFNPLEACTSILVTKGASQDGSTLISYSCDGEFHARLRMIPAADHEPGSMVEVRETTTDETALLCANCHRVAHTQSPPLTIEELKEIIRIKRGN